MIAFGILVIICFICGLILGYIMVKRHWNINVETDKSIQPNEPTKKGNIKKPNRYDGLTKEEMDAEYIKILETLPNAERAKKEYYETYRK